jgi:hypothetical protein
MAAANKIDALDDPARLERLERHLRERGVPVYRISGVTGEGLPGLLEAMWHAIASGPPEPAEDTERALTTRGDD